MGCLGGDELICKVHVCLRARWRAQEMRQHAAGPPVNTLTDCPSPLALRLQTACRPGGGLHPRNHPGRGRRGAAGRRLPARSLQGALGAATGRPAVAALCWHGANAVASGRPAELVPAAQLIRNAGGVCIALAANQQSWGCWCHPFTAVKFVPTHAADPGRGRCVHRRRGADGLWPHRLRLLGLPEPGERLEHGCMLW